MSDAPRTAPSLLLTGFTVATSSLLPRRRDRRTLTGAARVGSDRAAEKARHVAVKGDVPREGEYETLSAESEPAVAIEKIPPSEVRQNERLVGWQRSSGCATNTPLRITGQVVRCRLRRRSR